MKLRYGFKVNHKLASSALWVCVICHFNEHSCKKKALFIFKFSSKWRFVDTIMHALEIKFFVAWRSLLYISLTRRSYFSGTEYQNRFNGHSTRPWELPGICVIPIYIIFRPYQGLSLLARRVWTSVVLAGNFLTSQLQKWFQYINSFYVFFLSLIAFCMVRCIAMHCMNIGIVAIIQR